jgi:eukaryotic translation initiation factor 2C
MNNYANGLNVVVDLDREHNRPPGKTPNTFRLVVRPTRTVNLAVLNAWLNKKTDISEAVLEALSK